MKTCSKCRLEKELVFFNGDRRRLDGKRAECAECEKTRKKQKHKQDPRSSLLRGARRRSIKKGVPFSIKKSDIVIPQNCPVLGRPIQTGEDKHCDNSPTIDRIIPEKGYVPDNIRVISYRANQIKSNATVDELKKIYEDLLKIEKRTRFLDWCDQIGEIEYGIMAAHEGIKNEEK